MDENGGGWQLSQRPPTAIRNATSSRGKRVWFPFGSPSFDEVGCSDIGDSLRSAAHSSCSGKQAVGVC